MKIEINLFTGSTNLGNTEFEKGHEFELMTIKFISKFSELFDILFFSI